MCVMLFSAYGLRDGKRWSTVNRASLSVPSVMCVVLFSEYDLRDGTAAPFLTARNNNPDVSQVAFLKLPFGGLKMSSVCISTTKAI